MKQYKMEIILSIHSKNDEQAEELRKQAHNTLKWMYESRGGEVRSLIQEVPNKIKNNKDKIDYMIKNKSNFCSITPQNPFGIREIDEVETSTQEFIENMSEDEILKVIIDKVRTYSDDHPHKLKLNKFANLMQKALDFYNVAIKDK